MPEEWDYINFMKSPKLLLCTVMIYLPLTCFAQSSGIRNWLSSLSRDKIIEFLQKHASKRKIFLLNNII